MVAAFCPRPVHPEPSKKFPSFGCDEDAGCRAEWATSGTLKVSGYNYSVGGPLNHLESSRTGITHI